MKLLFLALLVALTSPLVEAREIGSVSTTFRAMGSNDKIVIESIDDPDVQNVACYISRAKTGGLSGMVGLAEDTADASISCRETGKVVLSKNVENGKLDGEQVFKKNTNIWFKKLQVVRFYDKEKSVLVYLTYSNKLIEGSPKK